MRDPERIDVIINKLRQVWKTYPDLRLCQLVVNVLTQSSEMTDPFYLEDDKFFDILNKYCKQIKNNQ